MNVSVLYMQFCTLLFSSVYFKLFTCQYMKTASSFLQLLHSSYLISSTDGHLVFFQVSAILVETAMPNLVDCLFACLSETWVWVLAPLLSSSPLFIQSSHFPTSIAPDSLVGRYSIL